MVLVADHPITHTGLLRVILIFAADGVVLATEGMLQATSMQQNSSLQVGVDEATGGRGSGCETGGAKLELVLGKSFPPMDFPRICTVVVPVVTMADHKIARGIKLQGPLPRNLNTGAGPDRPLRGCRQQRTGHLVERCFLKRSWPRATSAPVDPHDAGSLH